MTAQRSSPAPATSAGSGPPTARRRQARGVRTRERIVEAAMRRFADDGFHGTRVEVIAKDLGISKASVFQHFGTKEELFVSAFRQAVRSFHAYLDAPREVLAEGFFATLEYWLNRTEDYIQDDWVPYRVVLLGSHAVELPVKREINRFLAEEDPYGTPAFVRFGVERGEVRDDIDVDMIVALVDWLVERVQDALVAEELDPGLFQHRGRAREANHARVAQFMTLMRGAVGVR
ncbi:TetR/AcrR family transcriptional regulator [Streptomyces sp. NPDC008343]|uniref:TetR/AcrR family transcriptional regulator n=1 Tax=Streptomyces sp. NPDC008343 TaxID=3364828 RepID=UPI0036EF1DCD